MRFDKLTALSHAEGQRTKRIRLRSRATQTYPGQERMKGGAGRTAATSGLARPGGPAPKRS